ITSIYFDNEDLDLYQGRIEKSEGAEAIRLRWYGDMDSNEIFIERKTHHEDWTGEKSVKERFSIKEKYVNDYLSGKHTLDSKIQKLREEGKKSDQDLQDMETLAYEVQASVEKKHLVPGKPKDQKQQETRVLMIRCIAILISVAVRTFYNRTAFQIPGDARVRISLDTELSMVREDGFDGRSRSGDNWRRKDIGIDYPFSQLPESDICRFPYAILEVKLQTQAGVEPPQWVEDLVNSHLVEAVPKFSKFIHGISTLLEDRVDVFPFWFSQMDRDIRKPVVKDIGVSRASTPPGSVVDISGLVRNRAATSRSASSGQYHPEIEVVVEEEPGANSSHNEGTPRYADGYDADADRTVDEASALLGGGRRARRRRGSDASGLSWFLQYINPFSSSSSATRQSYDAPFIAQQPTSSGNSSATRIIQKRIAVPVRVEPKVFFANERTFLAWLNFAIVLGSLALGLLNFGDQTGKIAGAVFTVVAMFVMRESGPYDDRKGPTILVVALISAVVLNFYLKVKNGQ
ncbi:hypothetical protein GGI12_001756, partial [Dipsacomyces acuminosporus]